MCKSQLTAQEAEIIYHREQTTKSTVQQITIQQGHALINSMNDHTNLIYQLSKIET